MGIKVSEGSGRQPRRRALAWWMPVSEVRERYASASKAEMHHCIGSNPYVCQLVETYNLQTTVVLSFECGERPDVIAACCPVYYLPKHLKDRLEEDDKILEGIANRSPVDVSAEAKKAEKRRKKRQNK